METKIRHLLKNTHLKKIITGSIITGSGYAPAVNI